MWGEVLQYIMPVLLVADNKVSTSMYLRAVAQRLGLHRSITYMHFGIHSYVHAWTEEIGVRQYFKNLCHTVFVQTWRNHLRPNNQASAMKCAFSEIFDKPTAVWWSLYLAARGVFPGGHWKVCMLGVLCQRLVFYKYFCTSMNLDQFDVNLNSVLYTGSFKEYCMSVHGRIHVCMMGRRLCERSGGAGQVSGPGWEVCVASPVCPRLSQCGVMSAPSLFSRQGSYWKHTRLLHQPISSVTRRENAEPA